ncbi:hypothetical protein EYZ11_006789 [Aspergillus tanneri]|uniref:OPT superfamily oligopeptide transporter n=1 Tax=Aspergillus tanneri TaxID=1220188 RepID=A0A4S3JEM4_9EURO|nr:hypothetical protein EYZ11_006789 [Aspergillus tanneri]
MLRSMFWRASKPSSTATTVEEPVHDVEIHKSSETTKQDDETKQDNIDQEDDPEIAALPLEVRQLVNLSDDPSLPTITFRYFILAVVFVVPGAFLSQMSQFRTTKAPYSVFFVQIASHYAGHFLAHVLPAWTVRTPFSRWSFSLNPGPWSPKEHVLVTLTAASGAIYNQGYTPITLAELFYGERLNPAVAIFFMFAIVWIGYAFAAIARSLLLYDPSYIWPQALMQTTLFETFRKQDTSSPLARRQLKVFFFSFVGMTLWQFLPEYVFPFTSSLAFLCWVAPHNPVANFIGSGLGGMGFLNLSLDWSNINWNESSILLTPWWTQVVLFAAFVFNCWVLLPAAKWGNLGSYKHGLMSNHLLMANGTAYPILDVLTPDFRLNQTAFDHYGPMYMGLQYAWATFFDYATITAAVAWIATFGFKQVSLNLRKALASRRAQSINHQYHDRLNVLQRQYQEVPLLWYVVLFFVAFLIIVIALAKGYLWIPLWTFFVALLTSAVFVIPFGWLYAISNYQLPIGTFNEMLYGYMVHSRAGNSHNHPCGPSTYGAIAGDAWYRAQTMLQDQKIAHYMHVPPRDVFISQIVGTVLGIPVNYGVLRWVLNTKGDYLTGKKVDPLNQWTGQQIQSYKTMGVQGGSAAVAVSGTSEIAQMEDRSLEWGYVVMYWAYRKRFEVWKRYSYMIAAAFDAGFNLNMLLIFLLFGSGKQIQMPNWWGNHPVSVERCFALDR